MNYKITKQEKATLCTKGACISVYGDNARLINQVVAATVVILAIALVGKALK